MNAQAKIRRDRIMANISILGLEPANSANLVDAIRDVSAAELRVSGGTGYYGGYGDDHDDEYGKGKGGYGYGHDNEYDDDHGKGKGKGKGYGYGHGYCY
jgi:hypothetical protein